MAKGREQLLFLQKKSIPIWYSLVILSNYPFKKVAVWFKKVKK